MLFYSIGDFYWWVSEMFWGFVCLERLLMAGESFAVMASTNTKVEFCPLSQFVGSHLPT